MPVQTQATLSQERCILLLSDRWSTTDDGIAGVNRSLALSLVRFTGIKVFSTVFSPVERMRSADKQEAEQNHVTLVSLATKDESARDLYARFNENPLEYLHVFRESTAHVSHIVGHAPITAEAALKLRAGLYPDAKVILFYHSIPGDVDWLAEQLPYVAPTDTELVRQGEEADVVYSVTEKLHWYFTAKFRNRATVDVDHRCYIPQCPDAVFQTKRSPQAGAKNNTILLLANEGGASSFPWSGLDVAGCGINKVVIASVDGSSTRPHPSIKVGGAAEGHVTDLKEELLKHASEPSLSVEVSSYAGAADLYKDLSECALCLVPARAEPFGHVGLHALSAGTPTLIAEDSSLATTVKRLAHEPECFLVPVTAMTSAVRQDGSVWRDRILAMLGDPEAVQDRATQLSTSLRRDEVTKETHDNFISYCLGGIHLRHEATSLEFSYRKDEHQEVPVLRSLNKLLMATMKQCWRLKHHALTKENDLYQILPGVDLPIKELVKEVTNKIEEYDRRIVGVDSESGSFVVYCPTPYALSDLWAMCDRINRALTETLLAGDDNEVKRKFKVQKVHVRTAISGPEFLRYKQELVQICREQ